jgi:hypothetical protein
VKRADSYRCLVRLSHAATSKEEKTDNDSQAIPNQRQSQFLFSSFNYSITDVIARFNVPGSKFKVITPGPLGLDVLNVATSARIRLIRGSLSAGTTGTAGTIGTPGRSGFYIEH